MSGGSLAEAFVDILPNMSRFGAALTAETEVAAVAAGKAGAGKLSTELVSGVKAAAAGAAVAHFLFSSIEASHSAKAAQEQLNFAYEKFPRWRTCRSSP